MAGKSPRPGNNKARNKLRIIAGKWRGRRIPFSASEGLRPTPDRVRETLFNWLQFDIAGKNCLDLFAGSGALGLEALSRGAAHVTLVESQASAVLQLRQNLELLAADNATVIGMDALAYLRQSSEQRFDIIFLDPPYQMRLWNECIALIEKGQRLAQHGVLYFEQPKKEDAVELPDTWSITHQKTAGQINYCLATYS